MPSPTVSRAKVEELAAAVRQHFELLEKQRATEAQMIRWCLQALNQTTDQAKARLERERRDHPNPYRRDVRMHEPQQKANKDRRLAMLYLEYIATRLEGPRPATKLPRIVR